MSMTKRAINMVERIIGLSHILTAELLIEQLRYRRNQTRNGCTLFSCRYEYLSIGAGMVR